MVLLALAQQLLDARGVVVGEDRRPAVRALHLGALLLEDVAPEGMASPDPPIGGPLEALLRARMRLHLGHYERRSIATTTSSLPSGASPSSRAACARRPLASAPGNELSAAATGGNPRSAMNGVRSCIATSRVCTAISSA